MSLGIDQADVIHMRQEKGRAWLAVDRLVTKHNSVTQDKGEQVIDRWHQAETADAPVELGDSWR